MLYGNIVAVCGILRERFPEFRKISLKKSIDVLELDSFLTKSFIVLKTSGVFSNAVKM